MKRDRTSFVIAMACIARSNSAPHGHRAYGIARFQCEKSEALARQIESAVNAPSLPLGKSSGFRHGGRIDGTDQSVFEPLQVPPNAKRLANQQGEGPLRHPRMVPMRFNGHLSSTCWAIFPIIHHDRIGQLATFAPPF